MNTMNVEALEAWKEVMFENAKKRWPDLTPEQFGDAARSAINQIPPEVSGLQDVANRIEAELVRRYATAA